MKWQPHEMTPQHRGTTIPIAAPRRRCLQPGPGLWLWVWVDSACWGLGAAQQENWRGRRTCMGGRRGLCPCCMSSNSVWAPTIGSSLVSASGLLCCAVSEVASSGPGCNGEARRLGQRTWWCLSFRVKCVQRETQLLPSEPVGGRHLGLSGLCLQRAALTAQGA